MFEIEIEALAERANQFRLLDKVETVSTKEWAGDWGRTTCVVHGISIANERVNITLLHDVDQLADGFEPEDLHLVERKSSPPSPVGEKAAADATTMGER